VVGARGCVHSIDKCVDGGGGGRGMGEEMCVCSNNLPVGGGFVYLISNDLIGERGRGDYIHI